MITILKSNVLKIKSINGIESREEDNMEWHELSSNDKDEGNLELVVEGNSEDPTCPIIQVSKAEKT